ncbi:hypothetical protein [Rhodobacter capsulatus]|uniref:hypothetical protein n=1 Tax=Rhodobacter capsulatus TaxID=1061 RepID=UPI00103F39C1|nr:hypothetical protein [Rhodobacter capsulatus]
MQIKTRLCTGVDPSKQINRRRWHIKKDHITCRRPLIRGHVGKQLRVCAMIDAPTGSSPHGRGTVFLQILDPARFSQCQRAHRILSSFPLRIGLICPA